MARPDNSMPPTVKIRVTRDSVAAGDDCNAPHNRQVETAPFAAPAALIGAILPGYLPRVAGVGHSWDCIFNGQLIARVTIRGVEPKAGDVAYRADNHLHFVYHSATY